MYIGPLPYAMKHRRIPTVYMTYSLPAVTVLCIRHAGEERKLTGEQELHMNDVMAIVQKGICNPNERL